MLGTEYEGFHYKYFQSLVGPKGQQVNAKRLGSCCGFVDSSQPFGGSGLLDKYELTFEGQKMPVVIYVNLYKHEAPKAPSGFGTL